MRGDDLYGFFLVVRLEYLGGVEGLRRGAGCLDRSRLLEKNEDETCS